MVKIFNEQMTSKSLLLIGGMPSSCSTILARVLNSHPKILCGGETNLFSQPCIFTNKLTPKEANNSSVDLHRGISWPSIVVADEFYNQKQQQFLANTVKLHSESSQITLPKKLFYQLYRYKKEARYASILCEKSPPNILGMAHALSADEDVRAIITLRDPFTCVNSLILRGINALNAYNEVRLVVELSAALIESAYANRILIVKAEDFTSSPSSELKRILSFLKIDGCPHEMLRASREPLQMEGWTSNISSKVVSKPKINATLKELEPFFGGDFKEIGKLLQSTRSVPMFMNGVEAFGYSNWKYQTLDVLSKLRKLFNKLPSSEPKGRMEAWHQQLKGISYNNNLKKSG